MRSFLFSCGVISFNPIFNGEEHVPNSLSAFPAIPAAPGMEPPLAQNDLIQKSMEQPCRVVCDQTKKINIPRSVVALLLYSYVVVGGHMLLAAEVHALFMCRTLDCPTYALSLRGFSLLTSSHPSITGSIRPQREVCSFGVVLVSGSRSVQPLSTCYGGYQGEEPRGVCVATPSSYFVPHASCPFGLGRRDQDLKMQSVCSEKGVHACMHLVDCVRLPLFV